MMNGRMAFMGLGALLLIAVGVATFSVSGHRPGGGAASESPPGKATGAPVAGSSLGGTRAPQANAWKPPEGDPVSRYRDLRSGKASDRKDLIANFMALGHERNPYMLIDALDDVDAEVRRSAVEYASALPVGEAIAVLHSASANKDADVREMAWSLAAPYPPEGRAGIYSGALRNGDDVATEEAINEMGIQPGKQLFEMMLGEAIREGVPPQRQSRLFQELQAWLEPGGGPVPQFANVPDMIKWWQAQSVNYDEYLLRTDAEADAPQTAPR